MNGNYLGTMAGTGANIDIFCGFKPGKIEVFNRTSTGLEKLEWYYGMADGSAIKTIAAGTRSLITTLGITILEDAAKGQGFRIGVDTDINVAAEQLVVIAHRGTAGNQEPKN